MTLSEYLGEYLRKNRLTYREFANQCKDVSFQYIQMLVKGVNPGTGKPIKPSISKLNSIAVAMRMTLDELMSKVDDIDVSISSNIIKPNFYRVPLVGSVAAGEPIYDEYTDEYVSTQIDADCAMVVKGNSMYPRYQNGDIIYIKCQSDITYEGEIAVVIVDDEATLKHVYHRKDGLLLKSENPDYPDMVKTFKDYTNIRILGYVQGFLRIERK